MRPFSMKNQNQDLRGQGPRPQMTQRIGQMKQRSDLYQALSQKSGLRRARRAQWILLLSLCLSWSVGASQALAQDVACGNSEDFPCSYQAEALELQKVPAIFKFQSRISQAKLPLGEAVFEAVFVKVLRGTETVCLEQFSNVTVQGSVMNLEIGRNMSCELDEIIAENPSLAFQVCLGNQSNCLRPLDLAAAPYAVKSSFASQAQNAHKADLAGQAHYAHRVTADRDLLLRNTLGTGYFDFYTHPAESVEALYNAEDYLEFVNSGFIQWTPLQPDAAFAVHIVAKDPQTDQLRALDTFVVAANENVLRGHLRVTQGGMDITGDANIEGDTSIAGLLLMGYDPSNLLGFVDRSTHGIDGPLQITGQTTINSGGVHVIGDSDVQGRLAVGQVNPGYSLDVSGDINFTGQLRRNGELLAISGAQWDGNEGGDLYYDQGNIGVGTSNPAFLIDVNGDINYSGRLLRNGEAVPVSPWSDDGDRISYAGGVQATRFLGGQGSLLNDLQIGAEGTGLSRESSALGTGLHLRSNNRVAAAFTDDGELAVGGSLTVNGTDIAIGNNDGRGDGGRAMVHEVGDTLVLNYANDFSGGARVESGLSVRGTLAVENPDIVFRNNEDRGDGGIAMAHLFNDTLVLNFDGGFSGGTRIDSNLNLRGALNLEGNDLVFAGGNDRGDGGRAMVHWFEDALVLNLDGDFSGGTRIESDLSVRGELRIDATDISFGNNDGRGDGGRALVHDTNDTLVVNFGSDFNNVRVESDLFADNFIQRSDARIKDISGVSNGAQDLQTLRSLEITDYRLKDTRRSDRAYKMLIAQQVQQVYPQAVSRNSDFIPDLFTLSEHVSAQGSLITISLPRAHGLRVGASVLVETEAGDHGSLALEVTELLDEHTFVASGWEGASVASVFVFGRRVDDFLAVDYDAVSMLNVSATQELARRVEALEGLRDQLQQARDENQELRAQNERLLGVLQEVQALREELRSTCQASEL